MARGVGGGRWLGRQRDLMPCEPGERAERTSGLGELGKTDCSTRAYWVGWATLGRGKEGKGKAET